MVTGRCVRLVLMLLLILLAGMPGLSAYGDEAWDAQVTQVDDSAFPEVTVYVSVTDAEGQIVQGLTQEQFSLTEDGQSVTLAAFATAASNPISTVLVMDRSNSMTAESKLEGAKRAALAFVELMRPQDQMAIVVFDEQPSLLVEFTSEQEVLQTAIQSIRTGDCTAIYDGMQTATDVIADSHGRQLVILLTDGRDCRDIPIFGGQGSQISVDEAIAYAQDRGVAMHVIGLGERGFSLNPGKGLDESVLKRIASETSGDYYYTPTADELKSLYESLAGKVQQEYILTYISPRPAYDGTRRDIWVTVAGKEAEGTYLEQHLVNIQSDWIVGLAFLLPLLAILFLPGVLSTVRTGPPKLPAAPPGPEVHRPTPPPPRAAVPPQLPSDPGTNPCPHCGQPPRPGARFCGRCGQPLS